MLVLSQYVEERYATDLLSERPAPSGTCSRPSVAHVADFLDALRRVAAGGTALDPEVVAQLLVRRRADPLDRPHPRELQVLKLMAEGRSNNGITEALRPARARSRSTSATSSPSWTWPPPTPTTAGSSPSSGSSAPSQEAGRRPPGSAGAAGPSPTESPSPEPPPPEPPESSSRHGRGRPRGRPGHRWPVGRSPHPRRPRRSASSRVGRGPVPGGSRHLTRGNVGASSGDDERRPLPALPHPGPTARTATRPAPLRPPQRHHQPMPPGSVPTPRPPPRGGSSSAGPGDRPGRASRRSGWPRRPEAEAAASRRPEQPAGPPRGGGQERLGRDPAARARMRRRRPMGAAAGPWPWRVQAATREAGRRGRPGRGWWVGVHLGHGQGEVGGGLERAPAGEQLVQDHAEGVDVGGRGGLVAEDAFGGQVGGGADQVAGGEGGLAGRRGDAEVEHLDIAVAVRNRLPGLTSRWTTPARWAASRASAAAATTRTASAGAMGPARSRRVARLSPSSSSMTR